MTITFVGIAHSDALEQEIRLRAERLDEHCRDIVSCHVTLGMPHRHHEHGNPFSLHIDITTRGDQITITREALRDALPVAIREAFQVARRRLLEHSEKQRAGLHNARVSP